MTLEEIKAAVRAGDMVYWVNRAYQVKCHVFPDGREQWHLVCNLNDYTIGLTHLDGVTMNGKEEEFFIDNQHQNCMTS